MTLYPSVSRVVGLKIHATTQSQAHYQIITCLRTHTSFVRCLKVISLAENGRKERETYDFYRAIQNISQLFIPLAITQQKRNPDLASYNRWLKTTLKSNVYL